MTQNLEFYIQQKRSSKVKSNKDIFMQINLLSISSNGKKISGWSGMWGKGEINKG